MYKPNALISSLRGKTIAIVYIFEKEEAAGFDHFLIWKDNILTGWLKAVYELECLPYIIDVRTFMQKASNYTLPHIDYVINLNSGCYNLSTMGLVPSICSFLNIPCIPCDAVSILSTESKKIANYVARGKGIKIPNFLDTDNLNGIYRPINLGNSIGVKMGKFDTVKDDGIYQEFIPGYDVTIPVAYNFCSKTMDVLPPIMYLPNTFDPLWIYDEETKKKDTGFTTLPFSSISEEIKKEIIDLLTAFGIKTYARIDARIKYNDALTKDIANIPFSKDDMYFIEINSMPTIEPDDGFDLAVKAVLKMHNHSFYNSVNEYNKNVAFPSINGFLLASSMLALTTSKY